jgi:NAD(P)-dependent dehydrogenase (short-subunit alcohol dehydrogenase family)
MSGGNRESAYDNGNIVFVSTIFTKGFIPQFPCSAVGAMKAAYGGFAKGACYELGTLGIRVNTPDLGIEETPIYGLDKEELAALRKMQPLGENGQLEDIAVATAFLTERSPFTTGQVIAIDGGVGAAHYFPSNVA